MTDDKERSPKPGCPLLPPDTSQKALSARIHDQDAVIRELRESLTDAIEWARTAEASSCGEDAPLAFLLLDWGLRIIRANRRPARYC